MALERISVQLIAAGLLIMAAICTSQNTTTPLSANATSTESMNVTESMVEIMPPEGSDFKVYTQVLGQSGKIKVSTDENFQPDKTVSIQMDSLAERGMITRGGKTEMDNLRTFNTFANQDFEFSPVNENDVYPESNISVISFNFSTPLKGQGQAGVLGKLTLTVYVFKEGTNLTVDNETITIAPGNVKFNLQIEDYQFCKEGSAGCNGNGDQLRVAIEVKSQGGASIEKIIKKAGDDVDAYSLGGNSSIRISKKVNIDGNWTDLPSSPMFDTQGPKTTLILDIPMFDRMVVYDPTIELEGAVTGETTTTSTTSTSTTTKKATEVGDNSSMSLQLNVCLLLCSLVALKFFR